MAMLDVLVIGCGNIGGGFDQRRAAFNWPLTHAGAYSHHGGFRLSGCADPDAKRRSVFQARWGVPQAFANCSDAIDSGLNWDVISICSPTAAHHADVMTALTARPRLVFCEKPLAPTATAAAEMVAACRDAGVMLAVNHTRRWAPDAVQFGKQLAQGEHGAPRCVTAKYNKGVLNNGSHLIDLLALWFGPLELVAAGAAVFDFWKDDPSVPALLVTSAGVGISIACAHAKDYSLFEIEVATSACVVAMEDGGMSWRLRRPTASPVFHGYRTLERGQEFAGRYVEAMAGAAANIYDAVTDGTPLSSTGESSLCAQRLCESIRAASLPLSTSIARP